MAKTARDRSRFGRRVRRTVGATTVRYLYNGGELIAEVNAAGAAIAQYTYHGLDAPHSMRRNGKLYYYLQDGLGHVRVLVDTAGAVAATYAYTPYGTAEAGTETVENPLRFKGREWDAAAGLYFLRARYYDPQLGRFLAPDPLGVAGGVNLYAFAAGDPVNAADPTGLQAVEGAAFAPYGPLAATALAPTWGPASNSLAFNALLASLFPGRNFDGPVSGPGSEQPRDDAAPLLPDTVKVQSERRTAPRRSDRVVCALNGLGEGLTFGFHSGIAWSSRRGTILGHALGIRAALVAGASAGILSGGFMIAPSAGFAYATTFTVTAVGYAAVGTLGTMLVVGASGAITAYVGCAPGLG